jgi:hypothetical protein
MAENIKAAQNSLAGATEAAMNRVGVSLTGAGGKY